MVEQTGDYPVPTCESAYKANSSLIDAVMPTNGGVLQADGTWYQQLNRINNDWAQELPDLAVENNQLYIPGVECDPSGILTVLDDPGLQQSAADNLVILAQTRFDAPWHGPYLDLENVPSSYRSKLSEFVTLLSSTLKSAGFHIGVSVRGTPNDMDGPDYDSAYSYDFKVVGDVADYVDVRYYGYYNPLPRSIAPVWWIRAGTEFALSRLIPRGNITLGAGLLARYWPVEGENTNYSITCSQALDIVSGAGSELEWVESNVNGVVKEWYAGVGAGCIWYHDGSVFEHHLGTVSSFGVRGTTLFLPGMATSDVWEALAGWKSA